MRSGSDPDKGRVVRWRPNDLTRVIEGHSSVRLAERTVGSLLRLLDFAHIPPRPRYSRTKPWR